jgi:phosphate-selective porin OprO/OprP
MAGRIRWFAALGGFAVAVGTAIAQPLPPVGPLPPAALPPASQPEPPLKKAVTGTTFEPIQLPPTPAPLPVPTKPADPPAQIPMPTFRADQVIVGKPIGQQQPAQPKPAEPPTLDPKRVIVGTPTGGSTGFGGLGNLGVNQPKVDVAPAPPPAIPTTPPASSAPPFEVLWNNGLFLQTPKKEFVAHVGGTLHYDGAWYTGGRGVQTFPGGVGRFQDGANARRMRLLLEGTVFQNVDYKYELEFMNGFSPAGLSGPVAPNTVSNSSGPTDAWVTVKEVPFLGNVRIGNQKEWFSLEHLESHKFLMFLERSYLFDFSQPSAFNNGRVPGISTFRTWLDDRVFTAIGVYKNESDLLGFGVGDGQYAVTGRVAALPAWNPDNQFYWHVGGAMSHRDPVDGQVQVRIRNSVRNAPFPLLNLIANTGSITSTAHDLFNVESAGAWGPVTVASEYTANLIRGARVNGGPNLGTLAYHGYYTEAMVFLTGEHRTWDPKVGAFKRVIPKKNLSFKDCTCGAVEVGTRYTFLDLDDAGVNGGRLNNVTAGLTWYWNPNTRVQFNYDYLYRDGGPNPLAKGSVHSFGTRLAMDF